MFREKRNHIGSAESVSLRNESGIGLEVVPSRGAIIHQLYLGENSSGLLDSFEDEHDLINNPWYKQTLLFPFPNRLKDGTYTFEGKSHQFPINEPERNNNLHGFLYNRPFEIQKIETDEDYAHIELAHSYSGDLDYYPFPCEIKLAYSSSAHEFSMQFEVKNTGKTSLPYGFGWHPYFRFKNAPKLRMPECSLVDLDKRSIPTGKEDIFENYTELKEIKEQYDTCFRLAEGVAWKVLLHNGGQIEITADPSMKFMQIFNYRGDGRVAVEPMTCNINALQNGDGLRVLAPGKMASHKIRLTYTQS